MLPDLLATSLLKTKFWIDSSISDFSRKPSSFKSKTSKKVFVILYLGFCFSIISVLSLILFSYFHGTPICLLMLYCLRSSSVIYQNYATKKIASTFDVSDKLTS